MSAALHRNPPIGLMTEKTYEAAINAERIRSILAATERYLADDFPIPPAWTEELNRRQARLPQRSA